jgi:signal peptidase I
MPVEKKRTTRKFTIVLLALLGLAIFLKFNTNTVVVQGDSMFPTFKSGRKLLVTDAYWLTGALRPNDIVVVREFTKKAKSDYFIKRVYRTGGMEVEDKSLWPRSYPIHSEKYVVPEGEIFLVGDNRAVSQDSRVFGSIETKLILGKVVVWR